MKEKPKKSAKSVNMRKKRPHALSKNLKLSKLRKKDIQIPTKPMQKRKNSRKKNLIRKNTNSQIHWPKTH